MAHNNRRSQRRSPFERLLPETANDNGVATYAWKDNENGDVDFIANGLRQAGLQIRLDRWDLVPGKMLWEQIGDFISDPAKSDAWLLFATTNSLQSKACKEEFAYALGRALKARGQTYPVLALFQGPVDDVLIPPAISVRLFVTLTDPDWRERIAAAVEGRSPQIASREILPYHFKVHQNVASRPFAIEVRPRAGVWSPFFVAVPISDGIKMSVLAGPRDNPPTGGLLSMYMEGSNDTHQFISFVDEITPTKSAYILCKELPSELIFGVRDNQPQFVLKREQM